MNKRQDTPTIFTLDDLLGQDECRDMIDLASRAGVDDQNFGTSGRPDVRGRGATEDAAVTDMLWRRIEPFAPSLTSVYAGGFKPTPAPKAALAGFSPSGLNPRLRFYRYYPGQRFPRHFDIAFEPSNAQRSFLTVIIYLNDDFVGGETIFSKFTAKPKAGSAIVFPHELQHQGSQIASGVKWVLRTDVMYSTEDE